MSYAIPTRRAGRRLVRAALATVLLTPVLLAAPSTLYATDDTPPPKDPPAGAERTQSGLVMQRLEKGYGQESPDHNDYVSINFELWTPAGAKVQSSYDAGQPSATLMERMLPPWREALRKMVVGEKRRLWVPEHLTPPNPKVGPRGAVICDIELMAFRRVTNLAEPTPPADAERTKFGAFTKVLDPGKGTETADSGIGVLTHFTLWTENGQVLDSTVVRNRPTFFIWDRIMPAMADALKQMVEGEKRMIWIPGNVAKGQWVGNPKGMLTFEVEIVQIMSADVLAPPESQGPASQGPASQGQSG